MNRWRGWSGFVEDWARSRHWLDLTLVLATGLLIAEWTLQSLNMMFFFCWSEVRLGWIYAIRWGHTLYPTLDRGPLLGLFYGPISVLAYAPVLLCPSPVSAMALGAIWTACLGFAPVVGMHLAGARRGGRAHWLGALAFGFFALRDAPLAYSLFSPAHDVLALALGLLGVLCLAMKPGRPSGRAIAGSAVLLALATWSKPNAVFYLPGIVGYLAWMWRARVVVGFLFWLGIAEVILAAGMAAVFGGPGLLLQMFQVAGHDPIRKMLGSATGQLVNGCWALSLVLGVYLFGSRHFAEGPIRVEPSPGRRLALLCLLVAGSAAPIAVLGLAKIGGYLNSFSYCLYFLAAATSFAMAESCILLKGGARRGFAVVVVTLVALDASEVSLSKLRKSLSVEVVPALLADRFERRHPGEAYFPWNPIVTSYNERRYWTTEDGVVEPELGGFLVPEATLRTTLPRSPRYVAFPPHYMVVPESKHAILRRFYTDYTLLVSLKELPGWEVYAKPPFPLREPQ